MDEDILTVVLVCVIVFSGTISLTIIYIWAVRHRKNFVNGDNAESPERTEGENL